MKAVINSVKLIRDYKSKFGAQMYVYAVSYNETTASYTSTSKEQRNFIPGQEAEFVEEPKTGTDRQGNPYEYMTIKPLLANRQSPFGKALKKEQTRYSGFAMSYAKDLVIANKIGLEDITKTAWQLFTEMVNMDKTLE